MVGKNILINIGAIVLFAFGSLSIYEVSKDRTWIIVWSWFAAHADMAIHMQSPDIPVPDPDEPKPIPTKTDEVILKPSSFREACMKARMGKKLVIYFHASWCGPCKQMDISLNDEAVKKKLDEDYIFWVIDTDTHPAITAAYNVRTLPTLIVSTVYEDGKQQQNKKTGYLSADKLNEWLK